MHERKKIYIIKLPNELNNFRLYRNGTISWLINIDANQLKTKLIINIAKYGKADNTAF